MKTRISIIGTGRLGSAVARAFLAAHPTTAYNRTAAKAAPLIAEGAIGATTVEDAVRQGEVIFAVLDGYVATEASIRTPEVLRALEGKLLVQFASGSPRTARELAALAQAHGIHYLDGAVMATPNFIGLPECTILYSGRAELFERHRDVLAVLGGGAHFVGEDPGHASALDSALLVFMWGALFGLLQGATVCEAEGIPLSLLSTHLPAIMPVVTGAQGDLLERVRTRRYAADASTLASLGVHHGAFAHLLEICRERRLPGGFVDAMGDLLQRAMDRGHAQDDFAALHGLMRGEGGQV